MEDSDYEPEEFGEEAASGDPEQKASDDDDEFDELVKDTDEGAVLTYLLGIEGLRRDDISSKSVRKMLKRYGIKLKHSRKDLKKFDTDLFAGFEAVATDSKFASSIQSDNFIAQINQRLSNDTATLLAGAPIDRVLESVGPNMFRVARQRVVTVYHHKIAKAPKPKKLIDQAMQFDLPPEKPKIREKPKPKKPERRKSWAEKPGWGGSWGSRGRARIEEQESLIPVRRSKRRKRSPPKQPEPKPLAQKKKRGRPRKKPVTTEEYVPPPHLETAKGKKVGMDKKLEIAGKEAITHNKSRVRFKYQPSLNVQFLKILVFCSD